MKNIFAVLLYLVLLATSGQVVALTHYSVVANPSLTTFLATDWADEACATAAATNGVHTAGENFVICGTGLDASRTLGNVSLTGTTFITGSLTIEAGATLTLSGAATSGGNITNAGTLVLGANTLTMPASSTLNNTGTFTAGTGTVAFGGAGTITGTLTLNNVTSTSTLAISATTATINGNVTIGGSVTGGLKLSAANHGITATAVATIPTISAAAMTVGQTITFTPPTTAGQAVTVTAFTAPTTPGTGVILTCSGGTVTGATSSPLIAQTGNYVCTKNATTTVSAPIFSTKEKPTVFSEEVKN